MNATNSPSLARRIKRHIHGEAHELRIVPAPGWTEICRSELNEILSSLTQSGKFTPAWSEDPEALRLTQLDFRQLLEIPHRLLSAQACFWLILDRHVGSFGDLVRALKVFEVELYLPQGAELSLKVQSFQSHLYHEGKLGELITEALTEKGYRVGEKAPLQLLAEQRGNRLQLYLALGPYPLYHRHYKQEARHGAPLQECLAASALRWFCELPQQAAWRPDTIVVPFAGSGTLLFESWLYFAQIPPYLWRAADFMQPLPAVPPSTLASIRKRLTERQKTALIPAVLIEKEASFAEALLGHLQKFKGSLPNTEFVTETHTQDLFLTPAPAHGRLFLPLNPPYGLRLSHEDRLRPAEFYAKLAQLLLSWRQVTEELRGFILVPDELSLSALYRELGDSRVLAVHSFTQGGQHVRCLAFQI